MNGYIYTSLIRLKSKQLLNMGKWAIIQFGNTTDLNNLK